MCKLNVFGVFLGFSWLTVGGFKWEGCFGWRVIGFCFLEGVIDFFRNDIFFSMLIRIGLVRSCFRVFGKFFGCSIESFTFRNKLGSWLFCLYFFLERESE